MCAYNVVIIDPETGECSERKLEIDEEKEIKQMKEILTATKEPIHDPKKTLYIYNQTEIIDDQKKFQDVFNSGDIITVYIGEIPMIKGRISTNEKEWKCLRNITVKSGCKMIMVLKSKWFGRKMAFEQERWDAIDFGKWKNEVEFCWETDKIAEDGQRMYTCRKYIFNEDWVKYVIRETLIDKLIEGDPIPKLMTPIKEGKTKLESHFRNPNVRTFKFENTGDVALCLVSGRKKNFEVSPPIRGGTTITYRIKQNKEGYEFGVIFAKNYYPDPALTPSSDAVDGQNSPSPPASSICAKMYDSNIEGVAQFHIWGTQGHAPTCDAAAVMHGETKKVLESTRDKIYDV